MQIGKNIYLTVLLLALLVAAVLGYHTYLESEKNDALKAIHDKSHTAILATMSAEVIEEFNSNYAEQPWPDTHKKLALMDNPYQKSYRKVMRKVKNQNKSRKKKLIITADDGVIASKKKRFDYCQSSIDLFVRFAERANRLSKSETNPLSKAQLMTGNGVFYPFKAGEAKKPKKRPIQMALDLGWEHQGEGPLYAGAYFAECLALPDTMFYKASSMKAQ